MKYTGIKICQILKGEEYILQHMPLEHAVDMDEESDDIKELLDYLDKLRDILYDGEKAKFEFTSFDGKIKEQLIIRNMDKELCIFKIVLIPEKTP